jgi:hypothetical protein
MSDKSERERVSMDRRGFLKAGTATLVGTAAASGAVSAEGVTFEREVDAVRDLGLDDTGSEPINGVLRDLPDGTLVRFPEGSYLVSGTLEGPSTLGLRGVEDATLLVEGRNETAESGVDTLVIDGLGVEGDLIGTAVPLAADGSLRVSETSLSVEERTFGYGEETYGYGGYGGVYPENKDDDGSGEDGSDEDGSGDDGSDGSGEDGSGEDGSGEDGSGEDGSGDDGSDGSGDDGSDGSGDDGSGDGGVDSDLSDGVVSGELAAEELAQFTYETGGDPVTLSLEASVDMDLYVTTDGSRAVPGEADRRSTSPNGRETIEVPPGTSEVGVGVRALDAGSFELVAGDGTGDDLVLHLPFDGSGAGATDVAGGNDATVTAGEPTRVAGLAGSAMGFDGDDALVVPDDPAYDLAAGTLSMHVRVTETANQAFVSKDASGTDDPGHLTVGLRGGEFWARLQGTGESTTLTGPAPTTGEFHHVVLSFGGDGPRLYVDGSEVDSASTTQGLTGNPNPIGLGASLWKSSNGAADDLTWFLDGALEDLRLYEGQRSPEEIPAPSDGTDDSGDSGDSEDSGDDPNEAPTAEFSVSPAPVTVGERVTLDAAAATDPDGSIASYEWFAADADEGSSGDPVATGPKNTLQFSTAGEKVLALRVTDDDGATARARQRLTVEEKPEPDDGDDGGLPNAIVFDGTGDGITAYTFTVEGEIRRVEERSSNKTLFGGFDRVNGDTALGTVEEGRDYYVFSGDLVSLESEGPAQIELNPD